MKKVFLISTAVLYLTVAYGQTAQGDTNRYFQSQILSHYTQEFYFPDNGKGLGFNSGINIIVPISKRILIRTGINYSQRNMKYESSPFIISYYRHDANGNHESLYCDSYQLNYFQLPLYLQFDLLQRSKMNLYILSGIKANIIKKEILSGITESGFEGSRTTTDAHRYINVFLYPDYLYKPSYLTIGSGANYFLSKNFRIGIEAGLDITNNFNLFTKPIVNVGIHFNYILNTKK